MAFAVRAVQSTWNDVCDSACLSDVVSRRGVCLHAIPDNRQRKQTSGGDGVCNAMERTVLLDSILQNSTACSGQ